MGFVSYSNKQLLLLRTDWLMVLLEVLVDQSVERGPSSKAHSHYLVKNVPNVQGTQRFITVSSTVYWVPTLSSSAEPHIHSGGTYCLHLQGRRLRQTSNQKEVGCTQASYLATW
jgi:hypothetical protein